MLAKTHPAVEALTTIAERMVLVGLYPSPEEAVKGLALAQIEREIEELQQQISSLEEKYGMSFEEFTASLRHRATMQEEMDWEEWDDARKKLEIRQEILEHIT